MPLLTAREVAARAASRAPDPEPEVAVAAKAAPDRRPRVRMFHPDSTEQYPITCSFELEGEAINVERGVAVVSATTADRLESFGWRRGREIQ